ncbi:hypothetical protein [Sorangium sp. So ce693]
MSALAGPTTDNAQGELYLTDIVARDAGPLVGIIDRAQLAAAEEML